MHAARTTVCLVATALIAALAGACYTGPVLEDPYPAYAPKQEVEGAYDCKTRVAEILSSCQSCHSDPPNGAPNPLVTREQLAARSASDPRKTVAEVSLERMLDDKNPMPPRPAKRASDTEIKALKQWIDDKMSTGSCAAPGGATTPPP